jgi:HAD superfamily hydrolase (TIGR01509 family)
VILYKNVQLDATAVLLCDADGNLFPSEEPAFIASARVTNRFLKAYTIDRQFTPVELRLASTGKNFRATALDLAAEYGICLAPDLAARYSDRATHPRPVGSERYLTAGALEQWVAIEKREVTASLRVILQPDPRVLEPLTALGHRFTLAAVSSSAVARLAACLEATSLAHLFPEGRRFSAEDSLTVPISKPDPAIYNFAGASLGIVCSQGLAIEDSVSGAQSAIGAGYQTIGNTLFVPPSERSARIDALRQTGVVAVISNWQELRDLLTSAVPDGQQPL